MVEGNDAFPEGMQKYLKQLPPFFLPLNMLETRATAYDQLMNYKRTELGKIMLQKDPLTPEQKESFIKIVSMYVVNSSTASVEQLKAVSDFYNKHVREPSAQKVDLNDSRLGMQIQWRNNVLETRHTAASVGFSVGNLAA